MISSTDFLFFFFCTVMISLKTIMTIEMNIPDKKYITEIIKKMKRSSVIFGYYEYISSRYVKSRSASMTVDTRDDSVSA